MIVREHELLNRFLHIRTLELLVLTVIQLKMIMYCRMKEADSRSIVVFFFHNPRVFTADPDVIKVRIVLVSYPGLFFGAGEKRARYTLSAHVLIH